ncbi:DUF996 domain-containing protein [Candidatus Bathyarchaeota archaeon]|nr:DUF996 domain-containing protein [Candidatus Bathyarchaeota archaeon]
MTVESNRMMGGIGAALIVVSAISPILMLPALFNAYPTVASTASPFSSTVSLAGFSGIILFMVAMRRFAGGYKTSGIFDNALYGILSNIIVNVVAGVVMVAFIFMNFSNIMASFNPVPTPINIQGILGYVVPAMPVFSLAGLVQALFLTRAFNLLAAKSETRLFRTAGLALVASSVLMLILACIGALLFFAAAISATVALAIPFAGTTINYLMWIFAAKAFFSIKAPTSQPLPTSPATEKARYCPHCGAENLTDAVFCTHCGKSM